jgi:hypothetical protein
VLNAEEDEDGDDATEDIMMMPMPTKAKKILLPKRVTHIWQNYPKPNLTVANAFGKERLATCEPFSPSHS